MMWKLQVRKFLAAQMLSSFSLVVKGCRKWHRGASMPKSCWLAVFVYIFAEKIFGHFFLTSLGCSIGIHLPKMCVTIKFPMSSFVRRSNPRACTQTWKTPATYENYERSMKFIRKKMKFTQKKKNMKKKGEIYETNLTCTRKTCNSWKNMQCTTKKWNAWKKKREIHGKQRELHHKYVRNAWNSLKRTWNSSNSVGNPCVCMKMWEKKRNLMKRFHIHRSTWNSGKKRGIYEKTWNSWKKKEFMGKNVQVIENNVKVMKKTWNSCKKRGNHGEKYEIHRKTTWNSWKETYNSWKKCQIHEKTVKIPKKNVMFMRQTLNLWKFMGKRLKFKKAWNPCKNLKFMEKKGGIHRKKREMHGKQREMHAKKRTIHEKNVSDSTAPYQICRK